MKNTTFTSAKKKIITTLTAASCVLSVSAPALGSTTIGSAIFGNSIVASAATYSTNYKSHSEPSRTLSNGSRGDDVKWLQCAINDLVVNGDKNGSRLSTSKLDVDGAFGNATRTAVLAFQRKYGLAVDGYFGPASRSKMKSVLRSATVTPVNGQLSAHFHSSEFACKRCGATHTISQDLINKLESLYSRLNCSKIIVTSGYRDPDCSVAVGGYRNDAHTLGIAADVICYDKNGYQISSARVAWEAEQIGFTGIGIIDSTAIHLDVRTTSNYSNGHWFGDERNGDNNIPTFKNYKPRW
ncbi:peptidoglycan-binding protein [Ruminococcus albus]|uniref:Putative peptidoglycan binding domain-containing protein n=1 Tax=Ruminococcus albus TaxID=1264 RepID=A0A1H7I660_RUMAL|nr:peptidoglycan-binding protein [Ruminococcus albus]SEK58063.1 Putative peptidoglycan binding domain-containing protein [Ruminococcus albus]